MTVTDAGLSMIAAAHGLDTIHFTTAHFGDGTSLDDPAGWQSYVALIGDRLSVPITESRHADMAEFVTLVFKVSSADIKTGFLARELGIYAKGDDGVERLYAYSNAGERSDWFSDSSNVESTTFEPSIYIGNGTSFTAIVDPAGLVSIRKFEQDMDALKALLAARLTGLENNVNSQMGDFESDIDAKIKAINDKVDAIDVLDTQVALGQCSQGAITPTAKAYGGSGTLLSQMPGLAAGTYALGGLLQNMMNLTHSHGTKEMGNAGAGNCPVYNCGDCSQCSNCVNRQCRQCTTTECSECKECLAPVVDDSGGSSNGDDGE